MRYSKEKLENMAINIEKIMEGKKEVSEVKEILSDTVGVLIDLYSNGESFSEDALFEFLLTTKENDSMKEWVYEACTKNEKKYIENMTTRERIDFYNNGIMEYASELDVLLNELKI